jgi:hypothetical protein
MNANEVREVLYDAFDLYGNFLAHAIGGFAHVADEILDRHSDVIRQLVTLFPQPPEVPLYRGVLLDPKAMLGPGFRYVSWTEDRDVALWFASPASYISRALHQICPHYRGYLLTIDAPISRVLFHYSWVDPSEFARWASPRLGSEVAREIEWSLRQQREVITEPCRLPIPDTVDDRLVDVGALDAKLTPPWLLEN